MSGSSSSILEDTTRPVAVVTPSEQEAVVGSIVKLDARASRDPQELAIVYNWVFKKVPIGSRVEEAGFTLLEDDASIITFAPDITGHYEIELVVNNGSLDSIPAIANVDTRVILVPYHKNTIPDASFIWRYLSDFWNLVDGKMRFETFWSTAIQLVANELLSLYQIDYNKSIKDIQTLFQRRWLSYSPAIELDKVMTRYILADDQAGQTANTLLVDPATGIPFEEKPSYTDIVSIPLSEGNFLTTRYGTPVLKGRLVQIANRSFTMLRSTNTARTVNYSFVDGETVVGTDTFKGSAFTADLVGESVLIFGPENGPNKAIYGIYDIDMVTDSATLQLLKNGVAVSWSASFTGVSYSVLVGVNSSNFYADQTEVPGDLQKQFWRFSSTLISDEHDFEFLGVRPGDLVEVEVELVGASLFSTFYVQVVSVDRNRLGFVFNADDLVDGVPAGGLSDADQFTIASNLRIPGLLVGNDGKPVYTQASRVLRDILVSDDFKRKYFETELPAESPLAVGPVSFILRPKKVIRNSVMRIDDQVVSVPMLTEYVKQPDIIYKDGQPYHKSLEGDFELRRLPFVLAENVDYVVDNEKTIRGLCNITAGLDEIEIPFGDLVDRSVTEADTLIVKVGATPLVFDILKVLEPNKVRVFPTPTISKTDVPFDLERKVGGKFIRFTKETFSKKNPAPNRLWAEVSFFDNNDVVEDNFGALVGVTQEQFDSRETGIPYKSAVAGLMYALTNGPTIDKLAIAAHILLGLPFAENRGVIREINPAFKKRADGSPQIGRILIDATDKNGILIGLTNIYLYPQGPQDPDPAHPGQFKPQNPEFTGLAVNPETGVEYAVGDTVTQFAPLSKSVQIRDYIAIADWFKLFLDQGDTSILVQKYHTFQLIVSADVVSTEGSDFAAEFIKKAKAHYTKLRLSLFRLLIDGVEVDDDLRSRIGLRAFDNVSLSLPTAVKLDGGDLSGAYISDNGIMYRLLRTGIDLVTSGGNLATSPGGGFVNPKPTESFDPPLIDTNSLLVIAAGPNVGTYRIASVVDDDTIQLIVSPPFSSPFVDASNQTFFLYQAIGVSYLPETELVLPRAIWNGVASTSVGNPIVGLVTDPSRNKPATAGVAVGDTLTIIYPGNIVEAHTVIETNFVVGGSSTVRVTPAPSVNATPLDAQVYRESIMGRQLVSFGPAITTMSTTAGSRQITLGTGSLVTIGLIKRGDQIVQQDHSVPGSPVLVSYTILDFNRATRVATVNPPALATLAGAPVNIFRPGRSPNIIVSVDILDRIPGEFLFLRLVRDATDLTTSAGSDMVSTVSGENFTNLLVLPGDLIEIRGEPQDFGYGPGVFVITEVLGTSLRLSRPTQNATPGNKYAIQRRRQPSEPEFSIPPPAAF